MSVRLGSCLIAAAAVVAIAASAAAEEASALAEPPLVTGVAVRAPAGVDATAYEGLVRIRPGDRLSRRAVRGTVLRLFELGFANVSAVATDDGPGRVQLTFVLEPERPLAAVVVTGTSRLSPVQVLAATGLTEGASYSEDVVDAALAAIRATYARLGYQRAHVEARADPGPEGMSLVLSVNEGPPTRIASLALVGDAAGATAARALRLREGDVLDRNVLAADLEQLRERYRQEDRFRARVEPPVITVDERDRARVEVRVDAGPVVQFGFSGNRVLADAALRSVLAYRGEESLDHAMVEDLARRAEAVYRRAGYPDARVFTHENGAPGGGRLRVMFHVLEGLPLRVRRIRFEGNRTQGSGRLVSIARTALEDAALATTPPELLTAELDEAGLSGRSRAIQLAPRVPPSQVWDEETWRVVPEAVAADYQERGFLEVKVQEPRVVIDEGRRVATVIVKVEEGGQTRVGQLTYPGATFLAQEDHELSSALEPGEPLSMRRLDEQVAELRTWYAQHGYLYVEVEPRIERPALTPDRALVQLRVSEGPRVRAGRILVKGNERTRESVILDTLSFESGDLLTSDRLGSSQQSLMRLGIFRSAQVGTLDDEVEEVKDVLVDVRERPGRTFELGAGASVVDGPRAFASFLQRNLLGSNLEFNATAKVNYQVFRKEVTDKPFTEGLERKVDLGLHYPRLYGFPLDVGSRLDLIHELDINPAFTVLRWTSQLGFDWRVSRLLTATIVGELEAYDLQKSRALETFNVSQDQVLLSRFPEGQTQVAAVRPGLTLDLRDDQVEPHAGLLATTSVDLIDQLGGSGDFLKTQGRITGYVPLSRRWTLALSASGGKMFPLVTGGVSLPPKRFYLGGVASMRGFPQDGLVPEDQREQLRREIADCRTLVWGRGYCSDAARSLQAGRNVPSTGGDVFALGRAELRFPLYGELRGATYFEAGNLWADPANVDLEQLRSSAGLGIRYGTPVGPVALDVGFNLQPDRTLNESPAALHFSIGLF